MLTKSGKLRDVIMNTTYKVLENNDFNRTKTAKELGISIRTLRNYLHILRRDGRFIPEKVNRYGQSNSSIFSTNEERLSYLNNPRFKKMSI